jgi:hypothetical protein
MLAKWNHFDDAELLEMFVECKRLPDAEPFHHDVAYAIGEATIRN